jgi:hypothetical protein
MTEEEKIPTLDDIEIISQPNSIFENITFYINLFLVGICLIIIIVLSGVKAGCSTVIIFVISVMYFKMPMMIINQFFPQLKETFTLSGMSIPVGVLFGMCYLVVIAVCVGFGQINDRIQPINAAIYASQNGALFLTIAFLITRIPYFVNLFGNTFGYWFIASRNNVKINEIIRPLLISINDRIKQNTDYSFLITLDYKNINETIQKINENTTDQLSGIIGLKPYIQKKTAIGHIIWVSLASIATVIPTLSGRTLSISAIITALKNII